MERKDWADAMADMLDSKDENAIVNQRAMFVSMTLDHVERFAGREITLEQRIIKELCEYVRFLEGKCKK